MLKPVFRLASMILLAALIASALMYAAPGYFSDEREMDASHAAAARTDIAQQHAQQATLPALLRAELAAWAHGDLGQSRQFQVPVTTLLRERSRTTFLLLVKGITLGWSFALLLALPASIVRGRVVDAAVVGMTAFLLAVPVGAMATFCLVADHGGPTLVLALTIAARDLKVLHRMLRQVWGAPYILHARAQGFSSSQITRTHVVTHLRRELLSLAVLSFTLALSALVPVEVIFDVPGLGHLAWSAATNRDLPVLVAVTILMAACVGLTTMGMGGHQPAGESRCA